MIALSGRASLAASTLLLAMTKKGATTHLNEYKGGLKRKGDTSKVAYSREDNGILCREGLK